MKESKLNSTSFGSNEIPLVVGLPELSKLVTASKANQTPCLTRQGEEIVLALSLESEEAEAMKNDYGLLNRNNRKAICKSPT